MTQLEKLNTGENQPNNPEKGFSDNGVRHLGHTGISSSEYGSPREPSIDMEIDGIEPAHLLRQVLDLMKEQQKEVSTYRTRLTRPR